MTRRSFLAGSAAVLPLLGQDAPKPGRIVCPKSAAPAKTLYAMRLEELTSHAADIRLTLHCLQGLVNRSQPQLFLAQDRYDEAWLDWMRERGDIHEVRWLDVGGVFERFLPVAQCMFITDPGIPASVNVATMLAGVHSGLVATPVTAAMFNLSAGAYPDSSKVGLDLRTMHWKKDVDAYRWVFQTVGDHLSRKAVAMLDPATSALRDYLVEFQLPIVWIAATSDASDNPQASPEEEKAFARELFMKWPPNIPCLGWPGDGVGRESGIGEWDGVRLASECGKFEVCSGYDGYSPTVSNLSVHSGTRATFRQPRAPSLQLDRSKVYLAFTRSDGDGLNFQRHYYRKLFDDPQHGTTPIGWQIGPTASDLMPDILDFYYKTAKPGDCFLNSLTGVGYIHEDNYADNYPEPERQRIWKEYLDLSSEYRARIDASLLTTFAEMQRERLERFASIPGFDAIFANYGRTHITTPENTNTIIAGKPVFRAINHGPKDLTFTPNARRDAEYFMVDEIRRWTPKQRPAFLHVFLANWLTHIEMATNIVNALGPEYAAVRADQFVDLYRRANA